MNSTIRSGLRRAGVSVALVCLAAGVAVGGGDDAGKKPKTECPDGSSAPTGKPTTKGGAPTAGSQYETIVKAIASLKASESTKKAGECLEDILEKGRLCVAADTGYGSAHCDWDKKKGWGGDKVVINKKFLEDAAGGHDDGATAAKKQAFAYVKAALAHEGEHANQDASTYGNNIDKNWAVKDIEKPAVNKEKAVLDACGYKTSKRYKGLCKWLKALCARAEGAQANEKAPADKCPKVEWKTVQPGGSGGALERRPTFMVIPSEPNILWVDAVPGVDREQAIGVDHPAVLLAYEQNPTAGQHTLLILGDKTGGGTTQVQQVIVHDDGSLVSLGSVSEIVGRTFEIGVRVSDGTSTDAVLFDQGAGELVWFRDTGTDGIPDAIDGVFADETAFPQLEHFRTLRAPSETDVIVSASDHMGSAPFDWSAEFHTLTDTDQDGDADTVTTESIHDLVSFGSPVFSEYPSPGDLVVHYRGNSSAQIELWSTDADGELTTLLGTTTNGVGQMEGVITLPTPLVEGQFVRLYDDGLDAASAVYEVDEEEAATAKSLDTLDVSVRRAGLRVRRGGELARLRVTGRIDRRYGDSLRDVDAAQGGVHVRVSDGDRTLEALVPGGDPGWRELRGHVWTWRGALDDGTRLSLRINMARGSYRATFRRASAWPAADGSLEAYVSVGRLEGVSEEHTWRPVGRRRYRVRAR